MPVLIVEDHEPSARLLSVLLGAEGATLRSARNAEEALVALRTFKPRLIVVDLILPGMSGVVLVEHLRRRRATRRTAIVCVTALAGRDVERIAYQAGCTDCVFKPIDVKTFADRVAGLLGRAR